MSDPAISSEKVAAELVALGSTGTMVVHIPGAYTSDNPLKTPLDGATTEYLNTLRPKSCVVKFVYESNEFTGNSSSALVYTMHESETTLLSSNRYLKNFAFPWGYGKYSGESVSRDCREYVKDTATRQIGDGVFRARMVLYRDCMAYAPVDPRE